MNRLLFSSMLALFLLTTCGASDDAYYENMSDSIGVSNADNNVFRQTSFKDTEARAEIAPEAMLIRTATIEMDVTDHQATADYVKKATRHFNGFISGEDESGTEFSTDHVLNIRVPAQHFDTLVSIISSQASFLRHKNINTNDVSDEYHDLKSRIETKKTAEEAYRNILKSCTKIKDVLEVQELIRDLREEIESAEGRTKFLENKVSYSTINLVMMQNETIAAATHEGTGFGGKISLAFLSGWNFILLFIEKIVTIWPLLVIAISLFIFRKKLFFSPKPSLSTKK